MVSKYLLSSLFVLSTSAHSNTCNWGFEGSTTNPILLAENHCNVLDTTIGGSTYYGSISFACDENDVGYLTYYDTLDCTSSESGNMTNSTVEAELYECCTACDDVCDDIPIVLEFYDNTNCTDTPYGSLEFWTHQDTDICGTVDFATVSRPAKTTITDSKWYVAIYIGTAENCDRDSQILVEEKRVTGCDAGVGNTSVWVNFNNNTIHVNPDTTPAPTLAPEDCPVYYARFAVDFTVYDSTGDISTTQICNTDWESILDGLPEYLGITDNVTVIFDDSDCSSSGSSGSGESSGEGSGSGSGRRRLLQGEGSSSGESSESGESGEGGSGSSGCSEVDFTVRIRWSDDTDITGYSFADLAEDVGTFLDSEVSLAVSYYVDSYELVCCSSDDWVNTCTDEDDDFGSLSYDCEVDTNTNEDSDDANSLNVSIAFSCVMMALVGLFVN